MTMKIRLTRLLRGNKKGSFHKDLKSLPTVEEEEDSVTVQSVASSSYDDLQPITDPFADVRERMERHASADRNRKSSGQHEEEMDLPSSFIAQSVYLSYACLIIVGHVRDLLDYIWGLFSTENSAAGTPSEDSNMAPLLKSWEHFYTRRLYSRAQDSFNRPICSNPGAEIDVIERVSTDGLTSMELFDDKHHGQKHLSSYESAPHYTATAGGNVARRCLNLGSYNYLGFADDWQATCAKSVKGSLKELPVSVGSCREEFGTTTLHRELENTVATFLRKPDAVVLNMGFNTNATVLPALVSRGDLLISDALNHTSIVAGARASGAKTLIFQHNNMENLEKVLRKAIIAGQPRTHRPWRKIIVVVEGIYSMEGEYCDLASITRLCKKYGAYSYLDEAHSIGAMGATGRGISEYCGVDTADVDILMGTFTKSFGGMGGYIAANADVVAHIREHCAASAHHNSLSPVVCQQILTAFSIIMGQDGTDIGQRKLRALRDNSNYFRMRLKEMGLQVLGQFDSPIMPVMLYNPCKIPAFSRECLKRGLAVVVVGFPAVPLLMSRARFCISAAHTRPQLDRALKEIDEIAGFCHLRYNAIEQ